MKAAVLSNENCAAAVEQVSPAAHADKAPGEIDRLFVTYIDP
jgi:hypothetical protein